MKQTFGLVLFVGLMLFSSVAVAMVGDINRSETVDLTDAVLSLQVTAGMKPESVFLSGDADNDGKIGLPDAVFIMQTISFMGTATFSVEWNRLTNLRKRTLKGTEPINCQTANIAEIKAEVYDTDKQLLAVGGPWQCSDSIGKIERILSGENRIIDITAYDSDGNIIYYGEETGIRIVAGHMTDAGTIPAYFIGMTVDDLLQNGLNKIKDGVNGEMLEAKIYFMGAEIKTRGVSSNNADIARFFLALTRIASLAYRIEADGIQDGFKDIGDLLDAFGYTSDRLPLIPPDNAPERTFPDILPSSSPTGADLQKFLYDVVRPELKTAVTELKGISTAFNVKWNEPVNNEYVESDFGDVQFFKAVFEGVLGIIYIQNAYNLNADIAGSANNEKTVGTFLDTEPNFMTAKSLYKNELISAKSAFENGLKAIDESILWMTNETDDQTDDLISLDSYDNVQEERLNIADALNSLKGPTVVCDNNPNDEPFTLDLNIFFNGLNLREFLPPFSGDDPGMFPDQKFKGVIGSELNLNEDQHNKYGYPYPDGIPDILQ